MANRSTTGTGSGIGSTPASGDLNQYNWLGTNDQFSLPTFFRYVLPIMSDLVAGLQKIQGGQQLVGTANTLYNITAREWDFIQQHMGNGQIAGIDQPYAQSSGLTSGAKGTAAMSPTATKNVASKGGANVASKGSTNVASTGRQAVGAGASSTAGTSSSPLVADKNTSVKS